MRLSTRGRYALRAMIDLALHTNGPVLRSDIAERQEISADYIEQLFVKLRRAGLIESVKGPGGGYILAKSADRIRAGDIIRTVEGPIALVHCVAPQQEDACHRVDSCVTHLLWKRLSDKVAEVLDSVTLEDLCSQAHELEETLSDRGHVIRFFVLKQRRSKDEHKTETCPERSQRVRQLWRRVRVQSSATWPEGVLL